MPGLPIPIADANIGTHIASRLPALVVERFDTLLAMQPILSDKTAGLYSARQSAIEAAQDAEAQRGLLHDAAARRGMKPDAEEDARLARVAVSKRDAIKVIETEHVAAKTVSSGTGINVEPVSILAQRLARENAEVEVADIDLSDEDDLDSIIERERDVQATLAEQFADVKRTLPSKEDVLARAHAELNILAERGRPQVLASGALKWPTTPQLVSAATGGAAVVSVFDSEAAFAALMHPQLVALIETDVEKMYAGVSKAEQLTDAQRKQGLAELDEQRLDSELREAAAVFALWAQGRLDVGLRPGTSPMAILGIRRWSPGPKRTDSRLLVVEHA